jgi:hypothetical protein
MSILDKIKKGEDFQFPTDYFDKLPDIVFAKIKKREAAAHRKRILFTTTSIAASLLFLLGIVGFIRMEKQDDTIKSAYNTITNSNHLPAVDTTTLRNYLAMNETQSEIANQMEAVITDKAPKPVYASESELASYQLDESDYRIMEYYADEMDADSNF